MTDSYYYEICFVTDLIKTLPKTSKRVRITAKLINYSPITSIGELVDFDGATSHKIEVDFKNVVDSSLLKNSFYQIIGTLESGSKLKLTAETVRNVDGIDLQMFKEAVLMRRQFLSKK